MTIGVTPGPSTVMRYRWPLPAGPGLFGYPGNVLSVVGQKL
jgi:hypothetical protein